MSKKLWLTIFICFLIGITIFVLYNLISTQQSLTSPTDYDRIRQEILEITEKDDLSESDVARIQALTSQLSQIEHHSPPSVIIEPGSGVETASYIIFHDNETPKNYYAKNGLTGEIEFQSIHPHDVIQAAINKTSDMGGGTVYIKRGIYNFTFPHGWTSGPILDDGYPQKMAWILGRSNVTLRLESGTLMTQPRSKNDSLVSPPRTNINLVNDVMSMILLPPGGVENFVVDGGIWDWNGNKSAVKGGVTGDPGPGDSKYWRQQGFYFWGANHSEIRNVVIKNVPSFGVHLGLTKKTRLYNCYLYCAGWNTISVASDGYSWDTEGTTVENCYIDRGWILLNTWGDIRNVIFKGNTAIRRGNTTWYDETGGVYLEGGRYIYVLNNVLGTAESLVGASNVIFDGNTFLGGGLKVKGDGHTITNNLFDHSRLDIHQYTGGNPAEKHIVMGNHFNVTWDAIYVSWNNVVIQGNEINFWADNFRPSISINNNANNTIITENIIHLNYGSDRGIDVTNAGSGLVIAYNVFLGPGSPIGGTPPTGTIFEDNIGYVTENSGTATIQAGQTSVTVNHGLATTPTFIQLTPTSDTAGKRYWVSSKTSTQFTITIDSAHTSDISFDWYAKV